MIILVGIPGCGKSSILNEIVRRCPNVHVINYGDKMLDQAGLKDRDQLRKLSMEKQKVLGIAAAKKISSEAKGITIVDTHALIRTPEGYFPGLPEEVLKILKPQAIVMLECSPKIIRQRRANDPSRHRDVETESELDKDQELSREFVFACCRLTGAMYCQISNDSPSIEENARPLVALIGGLSGS